jgi:8-oxo-dGTP diphosphatase
MERLEDYPRPAVAADIVIFSVIQNDLKVLLIKKGRDPFKGYFALPGGFVRIHETLEVAAFRELYEETGIKDVYLEQLYTFGALKRDPRGRVISVSYYALLDATKIKPKVTGDEQIEHVDWYSVDNMPKLAYDHEEIVKYALKRLRYKLEYTSVGLELLPEHFTLTQLQSLYETILNEKLDKRNFRKKIQSLNILIETKEYKKGQHRPAKLYMFKKTKHESPFKRVKFEG